MIKAGTQEDKGQQGRENVEKGGEGRKEHNCPVNDTKLECTIQKEERLFFLPPQKPSPAPHQFGKNLI